AQGAMQRELQARVAEISRTTSELELTREGARAEIETGVLRRLGTDGVTVVATVPACRAELAAAATPTPPPSATAEAATAPPRGGGARRASRGTAGAGPPAAAAIPGGALFARPADAESPWSASRFLPGQESGQARFAEKYSESAPEGGSRQVCQAFANWSAD